MTTADEITVATPAAPEQKVQIKTHDGGDFLVDRTVTNMSKVLSSMIAEDTTSKVVQVDLPDWLTQKTMAKIIEYWERHVGKPEPKAIESPLKSDKLEEAGVEKDDVKFIELDDSELFEILKAANFLDTQHLLQLTGAKIASIMRGKSTEELRKRFNIANDFTPAEEEKLRNPPANASREDVAC
eukprot:GHVU01059596.1.p1 GENE.GHVU01059596.1~~GHVU01059596.1.p1  ORF type:complete len:184 (+),score=42.75 GHVU01059596.1:24-575(+)